MSTAYLRWAVTLLSVTILGILLRLNIKLDARTDDFGTHPIPIVPLLSSNRSKPLHMSFDKKDAQIDPNSLHPKDEFLTQRLNVSRGSTKKERSVTAAITYLVKASEKELRNLYNSISYLDVNLCGRFDMGKRYPVYLFTDGWLDSATRGSLDGVSTHCQVRAVDITEAFGDMPQFIETRLVHHTGKELFGGRGLGYALMIRWFMRTLFEHPAVRDLDFIMRLDTDSTLLTPVTYDPFEVMYSAKPRKRYAYYCSCFEGQEWRNGLHSFVASYMQENNLTSPWSTFDPRDNVPVIMPYNNIEVVDVKWWRSGPVQHFVEAVDRSLGIWQKRWGDAPIRGMAISLFLRPHELLHMQEFLYSHPWGRPLKPLRFEHIPEQRHWDDSTAGRFHGVCDVLDQESGFFPFRIQGLPDDVNFKISQSLHGRRDALKSFALHGNPMKEVSPLVLWSFIGVILVCLCAIFVVFHHFGGM